MEDREFVIQFLNTLITLICFLLSTIFMTSLYNIRSQGQLIGIIKQDRDNYDDDVYEILYDDNDPYGGIFVSYENSYTAIAVLFSFSLLDYFGFVITLLVKINQFKINRINQERNEMIAKMSNNQNREANPESEERINYNQPITNNDLSNGDKTSSLDKLGKAMKAFFIIGQVVLLIEIIVLTVYHSKSKSLEDDLESVERIELIEFDVEYFTRIYRNLIIVGYIFLILIIVGDLFYLVLACDAGKREKRKSKSININNLDSGENVEVAQNANEQKQEKEEDRYCEFFSNCIIGCCEKMGDAFLNCQREDTKTIEELENKKKKLEKNIEDLQKYLEDLNSLNAKIENKQPLSTLKNEMEKLHLPRCDNTASTNRALLINVARASH